VYLTTELVKIAASSWYESGELLDISAAAAETEGNQGGSASGDHSVISTGARLGCLRCQFSPLCDQGFT